MWYEVEESYTALCINLFAKNAQCCCMDSKMKANSFLQIEHTKQVVVNNQSKHIKMKS